MMVESDAVLSSLQQSSATDSEQSVFVAPTAEEKESCFNNLQTVDVWLAMQLYNTDLIELDSTMLQYNAFCKQQQKKAAAIGAKVGELLQSTVKVSFILSHVLSSSFICLYISGVCLRTVPRLARLRLDAGRRCQWRQSHQ
jgi:hypothetical protein